MRKSYRDIWDPIRTRLQTTPGAFFVDPDYLTKLDNSKKSGSVVQLAVNIRILNHDFTADYIVEKVLGMV
jgi:hypothetical protein